MENALFPILSLFLAVLLSTALVFWITTLWQVRKTAKAFETFLTHADETAVLLSQASQKAAGIVAGIENGWAKAIPLLLGLGLAFKSRFYGKPNGIGKEKIKTA